MLDEFLYFLGSPKPGNRIQKDVEDNARLFQGLFTFVTSGRTP